MDIINKIIIKVKSRKIRKSVPNPIQAWPCNVISKEMGCNRGTPIDRLYIEKFLEQNSKYIKRNVMEIGDNSYTLRYGKGVVESYIFTADKEYTSNKSIVVCGDLQTGEGCQSELLDCFILTQTLPFIYDVRSAAKNIVRMLKSGGVALITVSGISMLSKYDDSRWGHFWGFTETSLKRIFENIEGIEALEVISMGNPKTASAFLYGLSVEELKKEDFEENDELTPLMLGLLIRKK